MLPMGVQFHNEAKQKLREGKKLLGAWLQLCNSMSAEIFARAGFDFLVVDMEHSPADFMTLLSQVQAVGRYNVPVAVRTPWNDFVTFKRILDAGVHGLHIPYVNTADEARLAIRGMRYAPEGIRGIAGRPRALGYGLGAKEYFETANEELLCIVALETPQAVSNLDEMLSIREVDGIFIGPMDMATSYGHIGNPGHPEVQEVIRGIERKVVGSGKFLGTVAGGFEGAKALFDRGYQWVVAMSDSVELSRQSHALVEKWRQEGAR